MLQIRALNIHDHILLIFFFKSTPTHTIYMVVYQLNMHAAATAHAHTADFSRIVDVNSSGAGLQSPQFDKIETSSKTFFAHDLHRMASYLGKLQSLH